MVETAAKAVYRKRWLIGIAIVGILAFAGITRLRSCAEEVKRDNDRRMAEMSRDLFADELAKLKAGKSNHAYFYESRDTDNLVRQLEGMAEVEEIGFEADDLSEVGMASVRKLPRLRKLVLHRGRNVDDAGFAKLKGMTSLEDLELINTRITNDGLRVLQEIPNLRVLSISCEPRIGTLSDAGMTHLSKLKDLETLKLSGGWCSPGAVAELKKQLPKCNIRTDRDVK